MLPIDLSAKFTVKISSFLSETFEDQQNSEFKDKDSFECDEAEDIDLSSYQKNSKSNLSYNSHTPRAHRYKK
jgi:hypothetical protein